MTQLERRTYLREISSETKEAHLVELIKQLFSLLTSHTVMREGERKASQAHKVFW